MSDVQFDDVVIENYINAVQQTKFVGNCLYYICCFVIRTVVNKLSCEECVASLHYCILDTPDRAVCDLVNRKDRGDLSSSSVYKIISVTETVVNRDNLAGQVTYHRSFTAPHRM